MITQQELCGFAAGADLHDLLSSYGRCAVEINSTEPDALLQRRVLQARIGRILSLARNRSHRALMREPNAMLGEALRVGAGAGAQAARAKNKFANKKSVVARLVSLAESLVDVNKQNFS